MKKIVNIGFLSLLGVVWMLGNAAFAASPAMVNLGTARSFAVLAGSTITNTGPSTITGDLGLSPGSAVTGFPPGVLLGTQHNADAVALQAQSDLITAYNDAAGRTPATLIATELGGTTLLQGVYQAGTLQITGTLTLDAAGDPNAVWILQSASTLITASNSNVALINGAQACNVFWEVTSSATLGTNSNFRGDILALTSITLNTGAHVSGRMLARNGAVTMDSNVITMANCAIAVPSSSSSVAASSISSSSRISSSSSVSSSSSSRSSSSVSSLSVSSSRSSIVSLSPLPSPSSFSSARSSSSVSSSSSSSASIVAHVRELPSSGPGSLLGLIIVASSIGAVLIQFTTNRRQPE